MKDFIIENARPEDAAAILEYLKIVGGETDNLNMGAEGIPITVEVEEAFLRSMLDSSDDVMYAAKSGWRDHRHRQRQPAETAHEPPCLDRHQCPAVRVA